jgi:type VI protein secretion system component Hcp
MDIHDQFSLNYGKIHFEYWVQDAKGKLQGGPISMGWDVKASKKS